MLTIKMLTYNNTTDSLYCWKFTSYINLAYSHALKNVTCTDVFFLICYGLGPNIFLYIQTQLSQLALNHMTASRHNCSITCSYL